MNNYVDKNKMIIFTVLPVILSGLMLISTQTQAFGHASQVVTADIETAVKNAKSGQVQYRTDKNGIIHSTIGKVDFADEALKQNLQTLITALKKAKPSSSKGTYMKKITLSTTMGPGLVIDKTSVDV